jgi:hypothetical protein
MGNCSKCGWYRGVNLDNLCRACSKSIATTISPNAHSEKGLETIRLMGTTPSEWHLTEIKWEKRKLPMPVKVRCHTCYGGGYAHFEADGSLAVNQVKDGSGLEWNDRQRVIRSLLRGVCPKCPNRLHPLGGSGFVTVYKPMDVMVGIPQFPAGVKFDSRFSAYPDQCQLCAKVIQKSGFVPVNTETHAMWIGEDCARKFFSIKKWKKSANDFVERL